MRGQSSRPTYPVTLPPPGAPVRPYFSSMPESSYLPPAIQGFSSGYSGHHGQTSGQQSIIPRGCYECGDLGHIKRFCPRLRGKVVHQVHQVMIAAPAIRSPKGGGYASVLFDPGSTYSYVSPLFAHFLGVTREYLGTPVYVSTPVGDYVVVDRIYRSCIVTFCGYETRADLLLLDMTDFEVILGMDWLSPYHAILDFHAKVVTLAMPELPRLEWKGSFVSVSSRIISFLKARHMVDKGCLAYLDYVRDTTVETPVIDSVPVVWEFSNVFPSDILGMPPNRDIDISIDLDLGTQSISIPPYRMDPKRVEGIKGTV
ncbi:uncharacterized protein [Nicotiana tomentosiformis]|uniref:uncharacterized protein n=1 Tax=Nicotiana tomentosiformis TaxID=4098 RepID=UPI00388C5DD1